MVVLGLSSLTNIRYGMVDNLKTMVWTCIHLFLVYSIVPRLGGEKGERFVRRVLWGIGALWTVCVLISVAQYVFQISYREMMHADLWKRQGFVDNRLFGLFSDPNAAALMSICLVFAIIYLMETDKCVWKRCIGVGAVVLHCAYIILSGSRTAVICLLIGAAVKTALAVWNFCCGKGFRSVAHGSLYCGRRGGFQRSLCRDLWTGKARLGVCAPACGEDRRAGDPAPRAGGAAAGDAAGEARRSHIGGAQ